MSAAKRSPRAMPVETIITRYKSAQQQQQQQQIQKQQQHSGRHRIQKQQQHSGRHRIQKQQQMSERHRIQKQHLSEQHRQQNSEQNRMHMEQQTPKQHATEKQQLPEQHRMLFALQKEQQVTTDQLKTQRQVVTEQQKIQKKQQQQQYNAFITKSKLTSKPANVEKSKQVKSSKDSKKPAKKTTIDNRTEFYPEKLKRIMDYKRVVLRPKHHMKIIGGTKSCNKRKLHIPQKDIKRIRHNSDSSTLSTEPKSTESKECEPELSVQDMVLLIEEAGGLDGEDLLEILTCPSPVWWEDPPSGYIEEPLFTRQKPAEQKSIKNQLLDEQNREAERRKQRELESLKAKDIDNLDVSKLGINIENRGDKFMNKRCKLESLLGTLRNKVKKINEKVDLNINNNLNVKKPKSCSNISEFKNVNKNQSVEVQESNPNNIIKKSVNITVFNEKPTENVEKFIKNSQESNVLEPKLNNNNKCVKILESNMVSSENRNTKNVDAKRIINRKTKIIKSNIKNIKELDEANQNNIRNINNISNISADSTNREKRNSDSFEDDALLDLDDHEILSFENMKIPVAPNIDSGACDPRKANNIVYMNDLNKMNKSIFKSTSGTEVLPCKSEKQTMCREQKIPQDRRTSDQIVKSIDVRQSKLIKIDSSSKELEKFSFIRVRKLETLKNLNNETSDIASETSSNAVDDNIERSRDDTLISKNESKIVGTSTIKIVRESNCNENNPSSNKSVRMESSNLNIDVLCNFNTKVSKDKPNEREMKNFNKLNRRLSPIIDPIADCNYLDNYLSECKEITVVDEINGSSFDIDTLNDNLKKYDATSSKITENYDEDNNNSKIHDLIKNKVETNVRRCSIDSTISDKNMSVEYLDMSLLDEDENKMDIESHNYESEQSQESSGICKNINFKSDLDMTDSNMYDQINKSDNKDIIQYIRDNHKETQHLKDTDKSDNKRFDLDCTKSENFRSSSPINQKIVSPSKFYQNLDSNEADYVSVYKIVNSDSESDGNYMTTNDIKNPAVNKNNQIKLTDFCEMKNTAVNENKTDNSETITYEEEYLTEFDEVTIAVNELSEKNVDKTNEIKDAINKKNSDIIIINTNEAFGRRENEGELLKLNEVKINEGKLTTLELSKTNDVNKHNIHNYYKHRKDIRKPIMKLNKNNSDKLEKTPCKPCSVKNRSILISENDTVKYCLVCSSIYDTEDCKYCMNKLKKECLCEKSLEKSEYMCDRCNMKVSDKEMLISHLKLCNVGEIELLML